MSKTHTANYILVPCAAVLLIAFAALVLAFSFHSISAYAADFDESTDEVILASDLSVPVKQNITTADYEKMQDEYNIHPDGTPVIESKTVETEFVVKQTSEGIKTINTTTTGWVVSDIAPTENSAGQDSALLYENANAENGRDMADLGTPNNEISFQGSVIPTVSSEDVSTVLPLIASTIPVAVTVAVTIPLAVVSVPVIAVLTPAVISATPVANAFVLNALSIAAPVIAGVTLVLLAKPNSNIRSNGNDSLLF